MGRVRGVPGVRGRDDYGGRVNGVYSNIFLCGGILNRCGDSYRRSARVAGRNRINGQADVGRAKGAIMHEKISATTNADRVAVFVWAVAVVIALCVVRYVNAQQ